MLRYILLAIFSLNAVVLPLAWTEGGIRECQALEEVAVLAGVDGNSEVMALVHLARAGDERAFEKLFKRYEGLVYSMAKFSVNNPHDAEDITQQVMARTWKNMGSFRDFTLGDRGFNGWVYTITKNIIADHFRRKKNRPSDLVVWANEDGETVDPVERVEETRPSPIAQSVLRESATRLLEKTKRAISQLKNSDERQVMELTLDGNDSTSIAKKMNKTPEQIRLIIHRARKKIEARLADELEEFRFSIGYRQ